MRRICWLVSAFACLLLASSVWAEAKVEVLQTTSHVIDDKLYTFRVEKCYLGGFDLSDILKAEEQDSNTLFRQDISDAQISVAVDFSLRGRYVLLLTREGKDGCKGILGAYYYVDSMGTIPSFGPYTACFLHPDDNVFYWVVIPKLKRLREATVQVFRINPSCFIDSSYENVVKSAERPPLQNVRPEGEYSFRNIPGEGDFIPHWAWSGDVSIEYDSASMAIKISLIDKGLASLGREEGRDGGVMTIFYDISRNAWRKKFAPSLASSQHGTRNDEHRFGEKNCKTNGSETSLLVPVANQEKTKEDSDRKGANKIGTAAIKTLPPEDRAGEGQQLDCRSRS